MGTQEQEQEQTTQDVFGPPISVYTRSEALEDGVLVSVPEAALRAAGIRHPLALTDAAYAACMPAQAWSASTEVVSPEAWAPLLAVLAACLRGRAPCLRVSESEIRLRYRAARPADPCDLRLTCGPGDAGGPVLTLMLDGED